VAQLNKYFPKLCPPYCGLEINFKRIKQNRNIRMFTLAEVTKVSGQAGDFDVSVKVDPRYVNDKCTICGECAKATTMQIDNPFNYGMDKITAAYLPHIMSFPQRYVLDPALVKSGEAQKVKESCPYGAIDLDDKAQTVELKVGSIIWATGWDPYDAKKLDLYGGGKFANVLTNVEMERLAAVNGPTNGRILRPSDNSVRRVPRRKPPGVLFGHLLPGLAQAGHVCARSISGCQDYHLLYRHPGQGPVGRLLRQGQGRREHQLL
jgi:quinone-modifying oxidoreductase subunit QmoA